MQKNSSWSLEAFVEYDDSQGYLEVRSSAAPFEAFGGEVIPMHRVQALKEGVAPEFVEFLVDGTASSHRELPDGVSREIEQIWGRGRSTDPETVIGWLDGVQLRLALKGQDITSWGIGAYLLTETVAFFAGELGPENVRLIFRATPRMS